MAIKKLLPLLLAIPLLTGCPSTNQKTAPTLDITHLPRQIYSGEQGPFHVQGIAVDLENGYMYFSFTTSLLKTDLQGKLLGSVVGMTGHLGCMSLNPDDGRLYASIEYKHDAIGKGILNKLEGTQNDEATGFYVAVFDVDRIDRIGMNAETDDVKAFVRQDRHGEISDRYVTAAQLGDQAEALTADKMYGPELKNNTWTMARVVESRMAPDTLGLKVIVLPYTEEKLADSLKTVATAANFADLARQYAANEELAANGGEVGVYPFSAFDAVTAEALSGAKTGDMIKVMNGSAIQLFYVYRADKPSKHYRVATVSYPVEASVATDRNIYNQASTFAVSAKGSSDAFNEAASAAAVTPRVATLVMGDRSVRGLEHSREIARWAYGADEGDLSEIFKVGKDYVVAMVTEIDNDEYASVQKAAAQIRNRLMRDKKYDYIMRDFSATTLDDAAKAFGSEVTDFKQLTFGSYYVDGAGFEPALVGAVASTTETGAVSAPVKGAQGVYLFTVDAITPSEKVQTAEDEQVRAEAMAEGMMQQRILPALQQMSEIKDQSGEYF